MSSPLAILFDFTDKSSTDQAFSLLQELGYEPAYHTATRLHIHVEGEDLTSALEIVQACGGTLVEQAHINDSLIASTAYSLDAITIPAHLVNEDWVDQDYISGKDDVSSFDSRD